LGKGASWSKLKLYESETNRASKAIKKGWRNVVTKIKALALAALLGAIVAAIAACGGGKAQEQGNTQEAVEAKSYTYEYEGAFGKETSQLSLSNGIAEFGIIGNDMMTDVYTGTFTTNGNAISIKGLVNKDPSSPYQKPGLWAWINADGDAEVTIDDASNTFTPVSNISADAQAPSADGTYTYTYQGAFGEETAQLILSNGTAEFGIAGNDMMTDVYMGTYAEDGLTISIKGLANKDPSSPYAKPGLWDWINAVGDAVVTIDPAGKTFAPSTPVTLNDPPLDAAGIYIYAYEGAFGAETAQITLDESGNAVFEIAGNDMMTDAYAGTYSIDGFIASIKGLSNIDASSPYQKPGLWDWINADGDAEISIDPANGTFAPSLGEASAAAEPWTSYENVSYAKNSASQALDLYVPDGDGPFPLVVLVHGGGFALGSKQMEIVQRMFFLREEGYAVASIDYRLSSEAIFPAAVSDAKAAVRHLRSNASSYNLDPDRFAIWGESAGAYLAVMAAVLDDASLNGDATDNEGISSSVCALVDFYGPVRFNEMDGDFAALGVAEEDRATPFGSSVTNDDSSFESKFMGKNVGSISADESAEADPIAYVEKLSGSTLKAFIQHGDADANVPLTQSEKLAEALKKAVGDANVFYEVLPGASHQDAAFYAPGNLAKVKAFLDEALK
jgi:acetyl esterase/lipase